MLKIPKNVMQIGTGSPNVKLYMEDYVHTFLERCQGKDLCLAFGQQEEKDGIRYYLVYGAEKETDWKRGSFPYFQKLDRIGKLEKKNGSVRFWTVQGEEIPISGYFIFYEQNEEMQAYMIAEREQNHPAAAEEERVMEAISARREKRKAEATAAVTSDAARGKTAFRASASVANAAPDRKKLTSGAGALRAAMSETASKTALKNHAMALRRMASGQRARSDRAALDPQMRKERTASGSHTRSGSTGAFFPKFCRIGCLALLLILVGTALTSVNQYPDMKAVAALFAGAVRSTKPEAETVSPGLVVEETVGWNASGETLQTDSDEDTQPVGTAQPDASDENAGTIGAADVAGTDAQMTNAQTAGTDAANTNAQTASTGMANTNAQTAGTDAANTDAQTASTGTANDASAQVQEALARPESYQVQKGDSLIAISRRFYGTDEKVPEICQLNNIEDPNQIQPGQNILLPSK